MTWHVSAVFIGARENIVTTDKGIGGHRILWDQECSRGRGSCFVLCKQNQMHPSGTKVGVLCDSSHGPDAGTAAISHQQWCYRSSGYHGQLPVSLPSKVGAHHLCRPLILSTLTVTEAVLVLALSVRTVLL